MMMDVAGERKQTKFKREIAEWIISIVVAVVLVVIIRWFLFSPFVVDGSSMEPNFADGERIIANKIVYSLRHPKRGEVIVFLAPDNRDYIKRVIALPGETVRVDGDEVYVNGELLSEPYIQGKLTEAIQSNVPYNNLSFAETKVPEGMLFVMGDNRSYSKDSRSPAVGFVSYQQVIGRTDLVFWPLRHIKLIKHKWRNTP